MPGLCLGYPVSGRVVADRRSPSARPITCLSSFPWRLSVSYREVRYVIVGTPLRSGGPAYWRKYLGSSRQRFPPKSCIFRFLPAGWSHRAINPLCIGRCEYHRTELQDDELPCHEFGKGESLGIQCPKAAVVAPRRGSAGNQEGVRRGVRKRLSGGHKCFRKWWEEN
jgi:hypothetical protein